MARRSRNQCRKSAHLLWHAELFAQEGTRADVVERGLRLATTVGPFRVYLAMERAAAQNRRQRQDRKLAGKRTPYRGASGEGRRRRIRWPHRAWIAQRGIANPFRRCPTPAELGICFRVGERTNANGSGMTKKIEFPSNFLWGSATSAYQIEGSPLADGAGPIIWRRFAPPPGVI